MGNERATAPMSVSPDVAPVVVSDAQPNSQSSVLANVARGAAAIIPGDGAWHGPRDVAPYHIERLILHQTDHEQEEPLLVEAPAFLDDVSRAWFTAYLAEAERRAEWQARFADPVGEVSRLCADLLGTSDAFVRASRELAVRLHAQMRARPRQIARGDFVALAFRSPAGRAAAILKLDPDERRLVRRFEGAPGARRVRIQMAAGLLPDARALQKCALLVPTTPAGAQSQTEAEPSFTIRLLDVQAGPRSQGVAAFFYRGFLGAELLPSPRRLTRCFLAATEAWLAAHAAALSVDEEMAFYAARREALRWNEIELARFALSALPTRSALVPSLVAALSGALAIWGEPLAAGATGPILRVDPGVAGPVVRAVTLLLDGNARFVVPADIYARLVRSVTRGPDGKTRIVIETLTFREGGGA